MSVYQGMAEPAYATAGPFKDVLHVKLYGPLSRQFQEVAVSHARLSMLLCMESPTNMPFERSCISYEAFKPTPDLVCVNSDEKLDPTHW